MEARLQENTKLDHTPSMREIAANTKIAAQHARAALAAVELSRLARQLASFSKSIASLPSRVAPS